MSDGRQRILVVGSNWALLEGVSDLLDLGGYEAALSSTWAEVERALQVSPPHLIIIDLSSANPDALRVCARLQSVSPSPDIPILLMSFTGLQHIRELRWTGSGGDPTKLQFYVNTLLGPGNLLEKVKEYLAQGKPPPAEGGPAANDEGCGPGPRRHLRLSRSSRQGGKGAGAVPPGQRSWD